MGSFELIQFAILHLLVLDVGSDHILVPRDRASDGLLDLAFAPSRQFMEHVAQTLLITLKIAFLRYFGIKPHDICTPMWHGSGDAAASLGSPSRGFRFPGREPFSSLQQPLL